MKEQIIPNLIKCPRCGNIPVIRVNASKDFQVYCKKCFAHTAWKRKIEAVIMWYNMVIQYHKNQGTTPEE